MGYQIFSFPLDIVCIFFKIVFLLQWCLTYFSCDYFGTDVMRYWSSADEVCSIDDTTWFVMAFFAGAGIIIFAIFFPFSILFLSSIFFGANKKNPKKPFSKFPVAIRTFGSLFNHYQDNFYFWEIMIMLRKLFVTICFAFLPKYPTVGAVMTCLVLLVALMFQLRFHPYRHLTSNILESLFLIAQFVLLIFCLMVYASDVSQFTVSYDTIVTLIVVILISLCLIIGIVFIILEIIFYLSKAKIEEIPNGDKLEDDKLDNTQQEMNEENNIQQQKENVENNQNEYDQNNQNEEDEPKPNFEVNFD